MSEIKNQNEELIVEEVVAETATEETAVIPTQPNVLEIDIEKAKKSQKVWKIVSKVAAYAFITLFALFALLPFYWMLISSVKTDIEYRLENPTFFPKEIMWENYSIVFKDEDGLFTKTLLNTLVVGFSSTFIGLIITVITAFAFAKMEFKGKNLLFTLMLATMMIPGELFTTTNYITVNKLGWPKTYVVMIVPFLVSTFYVYLLRNTFMQVPDSLYRAAKVDGCGDMKYLIKVMVPLAAPTIISITLLKFIGTWNSYIWPRLVNSGAEDWMLLSNWVSKGFTYPNLTTSETAPTLKMAAATLVSLPLLVVFICFRKYIMRGVSKSGTKG